MFLFSPNKLIGSLPLNSSTSHSLIGARVAKSERENHKTGSSQMCNIQASGHICSHARVGFRANNTMRTLACATIEMP